jgi:hypothetical protein
MVQTLTLLNIWKGTNENTYGNSMTVIVYKGVVYSVNKDIRHLGNQAGTTWRKYWYAVTPNA